MTDLNHHCRWLAGPAFLSHSEDHWPQDTFVEPLREDDSEVKTNKWSGHTSTSETEPTFQTRRSYRLGHDSHVSVVAWICRFVRNCKLKAEDRLRTPLTASEIRNTEMVAIRRSQRDSFPIDIDALKANKRLQVKGRLSSLLPYLDEEQLLRVECHLRKAPVSSDARNPLILHPKHHITRLIVMHHNLRLYCTSNKHVLNELRQKYWILKGLATVQRISSICPSCRRKGVQPVPPVTADLPDSRLGYQLPPITNRGVDYFGPILVRNGR